MEVSRLVITADGRLWRQDHGSVYKPLANAEALFSFTPGKAGLVPNPGGSPGTTKFLREDGTWVVPAGGSGSSAPAGAHMLMIGEDPDVMMVFGPPGAAGAAGGAGATGPSGAAGRPGVDGIDGEDGATGPPGPVGLAGATGSSGAAGPQGVIGFPGFDGDDGLDGLPGPPGSPGAAGATGSPGGPGALGPMGVPGFDGLDGEDSWLPGPAGVAGVAGSPGAPGATGPFGRGGTVLNPAAPVDVMVWRAPFDCTVTNVRGHRKGGTGATINARRNQASDHLSFDLSLGTADLWADGGSVLNAAYVTGDDLEIQVKSVSGAVTEIAVQVDYSRP